MQDDVMSNESSVELSGEDDFLSPTGSLDSGSFYLEHVASVWEDSLGDFYYSHQETEELADLVSRERREQLDVERTTEHLRKWIK